MSCAFIDGIGRFNTPIVFNIYENYRPFEIMFPFSCDHLSYPRDLCTIAEWAYPIKASVACNVGKPSGCLIRDW